MEYYLSLFWKLIFQEPLEVVYLLTIILLTIILLTKKRSTKYILFIFLFTLNFGIIWGSFLAFMQYQTWKNHPISQRLLPPFQDISYFLQYSLFHFFRDFWFRLWGILLTFGFIFLIIFILKRDPFYNEEKLLIPLLTFMFPFPYNISFIIVGFFLLMVYMSFLFFTKKINLREMKSFYGFWLLLAWIFVILKPFFYQNIKFIFNKP